MIHPLTTNLDQVPYGSKDRSRISHATECYMFPEKTKTKQVSKFKKKINNLRKDY